MPTPFTNPDDLYPRADRYAAEQVECGWYDEDLLNEVVRLNREDPNPDYRPAGMS